VSRARTSSVVLLAFAFLVCAGCSGPADEDGSGPPAAVEGTVPVPRPDLGALDAAFRERIETAQEELDAAAAPDGSAYGRLGSLYLAAEYEDAAEACFRNAHALDASDFRWPYYLGHIYRERAELEPAVDGFEGALAVRPDDLAALGWLAATYRELGHAELATERYRRLLELQPDSAFARLGLGKLALERGDAATAVEHLAEALRLAPTASIIHYPLGVAYRELGDTERAKQHLEQRGDVDILPADPWMDEIRGLLSGPMLWVDRGTEAYVAGKWETAVRAFGEALAGAPEDAPVRVSLAAALFRAGDTAGAEARYVEALRLDPASSRALYGLGALAENAGDDEGAIERYRAALQAEPGYPPAHLRLAETLRRSGEAEQALRHYAPVVAADPRQAEARLGSAMCLVHLERWTAARDELEGAVGVLPDQPALAHALARILVSAPDDAVRDARRAMVLLGPLARQGQNTEVAETIAMALAEAGRFDEAIEWQRKAIEVVRSRGGDAGRMQENLALYERGEACRTPWPPEHELFHPVRNALPALPQREKTS
jgi:tetratricopeptide (TPR) repeat protein